MITASDRLHELQEKAWFPYVLPFALFLLFTEPARFFPSLVPLLYIAKTILVGGLLCSGVPGIKRIFPSSSLPATG